MIRPTCAVGLLLAVVSGAIPIQVCAEFYRWTDAQGRERVSNLPPPAIGSNGHPEPNQHPWSVRSQHPAMRAELERQAASLEAAEAAVSSAAARRQSAFKALLDGIDIAPSQE